MARLTMTYAIAHAAACDEGNRSMREAGRTKWNRDDYNASVWEFNRLWPWPCDGSGRDADQMAADPWAVAFRAAQEVGA